MDDYPDFSQLQVLIVGGKAHAAHTLRTTLGIAGVKHVTAVADS